MISPVLNGFFAAIFIGSIVFGAAFALISLLAIYEKFVKRKDDTEK